MVRALFLSESALKEASVLNENIDWKLLKPILVKVQELRILELLGTSLYNDLQDGIISDQLASNAAYKTLLTEYIQPVMIQYMVCDSTPELMFKFMNIGLSKKRSENADGVTYDEALKMIERYQADAEIYQNRLIRFLLAKANTDYPKYFDVGQDMSYIYPKRGSFTSPIYLGQRSNGNIWNLETMIGGPIFPGPCD